MYTAPRKDPKPVGPSNTTAESVDRCGATAETTAETNIPSEAFEALEGIYGAGSSKAGWKRPRQQMTNADLARIINSDEIQSCALRAKKLPVKNGLRKKNPLKNLGFMLKLNPYALTARRAEWKKQNSKSAAKKSGNSKADRSAFYETLIAEEADESDDDE